MAENTLPKKNTPYTFYVALVDTGSRPDFRANPTLAAGDVQVSTDGAGYGNLGTLPVVTPAGGVAVRVDLSAAEINGDNVTVKFIDAAGAEWDDLFIELRPATRKAEDLAFPTTSGRSLDITATGAAGIDWGNVENKTTANDLSGTDIQLCDTITTYTSDTPQTGDNFARIGAPVGASISADLADVPTVSEFNARTLVAASYFDPAADTVVNVTTVATLTGHTAQTADHTANISSILTDTGTTLDDHLTDIKGTAFVKNTHSLIDIEAYVDILDDGTSGNVKIATDVAAVLVDTAVIDVSVGEPAQGAPPVSASPFSKIDYLYKAWRNKIEQTATTMSVYNNAGSVVDHKATVSDDSTTFTREEVESGP